MVILHTVGIRLYSMNEISLADTSKPPLNINPVINISGGRPVLEGLLH